MLKIPSGEGVTLFCVSEPILKESEPTRTPSGDEPPASESKQTEPQRKEVPVELVHLRRLRRLVNGLTPLGVTPWLAQRNKKPLGSQEEREASATPQSSPPPSPLELPRLYRFASSLIARLEATGEHPRLLRETRELVIQTHGLLYRDRGIVTTPWHRRAVRFLLVECPRTIREEKLLLGLSFFLFYGLAVLSYFAVQNDLDLAPSLLNPEMVRTEIEQLEATADGEPYRGNFNFGWAESPSTAGWLMLHNMGVGVLFFSFALLPPLYLYVLTSNALMLGTYTAVASHWGQAGAISSLLWCHGVLELQAIVLAGTAGLCLIRSLIRPGPWTRRHALAKASKKSLRLLLPVFPMLFFAGLIEAFVTPHAPVAVRISVAIGTGILLLAWALLGGRERPTTALRTART